MLSFIIRMYYIGMIIVGMVHIGFYIVYNFFVDSKK